MPARAKAVWRLGHPANIWTSSAGEVQWQHLVPLVVLICWQVCKAKSKNEDQTFTGSLHPGSEENTAGLWRCPSVLESPTAAPCASLNCYVSALVPFLHRNHFLQFLEKRALMDIPAHNGV